MYVIQKRFSFLLNWSVFHPKSSHVTEPGLGVHTFFFIKMLNCSHHDNASSAGDASTVFFQPLHIWQFHIEEIFDKSVKVWLMCLQCIKTPLYVAPVVSAVHWKDTDSVFVVTLTSLELYFLWCCAALWVYQCLPCLRIRRGGLTASILLLPRLACELQTSTCHFLSWKSECWRLIIR